jgi:hypothetical protein
VHRFGNRCKTFLHAFHLACAQKRRHEILRPTHCHRRPSRALIFRGSLMPNGFHGAPQEWARLELPLTKLDARLVNFAYKHQLSLSKNHSGYPERSLRSSDDGLQRLIQIYLEDEHDLTFNLWICASEDRGDERFWKRKFLCRAVPAQEIDNNLESLLREAFEIARSWARTDLELGTKIKRHP